MNDSVDHHRLAKTLTWRDGMALALALPTGLFVTFGYPSRGCRRVDRNYGLVHRSRDQLPAMPSLCRDGIDVSA